MREKTYHLYLNEEERSQVIQLLIALKNNLAAQGRYTDAVDDVLCKVLEAKVKSKFRKLNTFRTCFAVCFLTGAGGLFLFTKKFLQKNFRKSGDFGCAFHTPLSK